jgi:photosystem II stability/assembly factor-like uncharacterized protein
MHPRRVSLHLTALILVCLAFAGTAHAQWSHTNGSEGGFALALLNTPEYMLIGLEGGGIYRSTDDGASWQFASSGLSGFDPSGYAFAVLGQRVFVSSGFSIYNSTDGGFTWAPTGNGLPPYGVFVAGLASREGVLFAGASSSGVYRSIDSGATWTKTLSTPADSDVSTIFCTGQYLFVGTYEGGVFRSTNDGATWQARSTGLATGDGRRILSFAEAGGTVFVGTRAGAYHSTDDGDTWIPATSGLTSMSVSSVMGLGMDVLAGTYGGGVYLSTNGGVDWSWSSTGWDGGNVRAFCVRGGMIFGASYGLHPLYRSSDQGATWMSIGSGITSESMSALAGTATRVFSAAYGGLHLTTDNGDTWSTPPILAGKVTTAVETSGGITFAGTSYDGPYLSTDDGESWGAAAGGLNTTNARRMGAFACDSSAWYAGTWGGVYRSTNNGGLWTAASNGLSDTTVTALCAANGRVFAGTRTALYLSTNGGALWTVLTNGLPAQKVSSIVNLQGIVMVAYALGGSPSVYKSTDNGLSWSPVSNGLSGGAVIQHLCVYGNDIFGGTLSNGVWLSTDAGENWEDISAGLNGPALKVAALTTSGGFLYVGAIKGGIWSRPLSQVVSVDDRGSGTAVEGFHLAQNYPNPFNPTTTIAYTIPDQAGTMQAMSLQVFDLLGRQVATLVNGPVTPGAHSVVFDASALSSGVYFYRLHAGSFTEVKTLMLIK